MKSKNFPTRLILILLILLAASSVLFLMQTGFKFNISNPFVKTEKNSIFYRNS